jgi:hypothetical protein
MEGAVIKTHAPKLCHAEFAAGRVSITFAGNARKAEAAISACVRRLRLLESDEDAFTALEEVVDTQYRKLVHQDPEFGKNDALHYSLTFAVWIRNDNRVYLWNTYDVSLYEPTVDFVCSGIGFELAHYIIDPLFSGDMTEEEAFFLAVYMMCRVSDNVQGIGGNAHFLSVRHDGNKSPVMGIELSDVMKYTAKGWDAVAARLLIASALKQDDKKLELFAQFSAIHGAASDFWNFFITRDPEVERYLRSPIAAPSHAPPSPESPEDSGES